MAEMARARRQALPEPEEKEPPLNLWALLKDAVGKARRAHPYTTASHFADFSF